MSELISPHGSDRLNPLFVADVDENTALAKKAEGLPSVLLSSASAANAVMLAGGYFTPLTGYMNRADALGVANHMQTSDGLFWPTPVLNLVADAGGIEAGTRIALRDPNVDGEPVLAVMDVEAVERFSDADMADRHGSSRRRGVQLPGANRLIRADPGAQFQLFQNRFSGHVPHGGRDPRRDCRPRLVEGCRLPDPQPDAPGA